jgi:hypothetical protein
MASLVRAGAASVSGDRDVALFHLRSAESGFRTHEMRLHAATAAMRIGQLLGGDAGRTAVEDAVAWMKTQNIRNPARMAAMLSTGFED